MLLRACLQQTRGTASKFGYYTQDVRVPSPPKQRSKIWRLTVHKKLIWVANGHLNDYSQRAPKEEPKQVPVTAVVFAKSGTYKLIHNFTKQEFEFILQHADKIRAMFEEQSLLKDALERKDVASKHRCI